LWWLLPEAFGLSRLLCESTRLIVLPLTTVLKSRQNR